MGEENVRNSIATMEIGQLVSEFVTCKGHLVELTFYGFIEPLELITELLLEDGKEIKGTTSPIQRIVRNSSTT